MIYTVYAVEIDTRLPLTQKFDTREDACSYANDLAGYEQIDISEYYSDLDEMYADLETE